MGKRNQRKATRQRNDASGQIPAKDAGSDEPDVEASKFPTISITLPVCLEAVKPSARYLPGKVEVQHVPERQSLALRGVVDGLNHSGVKLSTQRCQHVTTQVDAVRYILERIAAAVARLNSEDNEAV